MISSCFAVVEKKLKAAQALSESFEVVLFFNSCPAAAPLEVVRI